MFREADPERSPMSYRRLGPAHARVLANVVAVHVDQRIVVGAHSNLNVGAGPVEGALKGRSFKIK
jgi:hypothetical protein